MTIEIVVPPSSLGPRRTGDLLCRALIDDGVDARLVDRPSGPLANVHLSNSSRGLLVPLARRRGCLVTLHDVVPRQRKIRPLVLPVLRRVLPRHRVLVHSRYAADVLRAQGIEQDIGIVPLAMPVEQQSPGAREAAHDELLAGSSGPVLVLAGVLKAGKGVAEVVAAARDVPDARIVLVGRVADRPTARALAARPANVTVVERAADPEFCRIIAASDALLLPRSESVGETSGPLVMAHALGTPVAMFDTGSAPEYALPGDLVAPVTTSVADLVGQAAARSWRRAATSLDDAVAGVVAAYRREFAALGWLETGDGGTAHPDPSDESLSLTDDHPA